MWAQLKRYTKAHCKYSIGSLHKNIPLSIESITTENIKNHIRKVKHYMFAYLQGIKVVKELDETIKSTKRRLSHTEESAYLNRPSTSIPLHFLLVTLFFITKRAHHTFF